MARWDVPQRDEPGVVSRCCFVRWSPIKVWAHAGWRQRGENNRETDPLDAAAALISDADKDNQVREYKLVRV